MEKYTAVFLPLSCLDSKQDVCQRSGMNKIAALSRLKKADVYKVRRTELSWCKKNVIKGGVGLLYGLSKK
ncbi:MAG: hypothetical protein K2Q15_05655 [Burkholderiales bacterium]|nr:hypothetical protein [Burkholderiales bacterium]